MPLGEMTSGAEALWPFGTTLACGGVGAGGAR